MAEQLYVGYDKQGNMIRGRVKTQQVWMLALGKHLQPWCAAYYRKDVIAQAQHHFRLRYTWEQLEAQGYYIVKVPITWEPRTKPANTTASGGAGGRG